MSLRIWTPVWGEKHIGLLTAALGRSFLWPKNHEAIKDAKWMLMIHGSEYQQVMAAATKILPEEQIETIEMSESMSDLTAQRGILMNDALLTIIPKCLSDKSQMLISTPDFIWGDGTIANMRRLGEQKGTCVALAHPRVKPTIIRALELDAPTDNFGLVTLAMKHPHESWVTSELGKDPNTTHKGGILWRKISPGMITVQHRMPSPYLVNFLPSDLDYFKTDTPSKRAAFGAWDHDWPEVLLEHERWRMILSSDVGFMAEVTSDGDNMSGFGPIDHGEPDSYWHGQTHHRMNRQFVATMRGAP